MESEKITIVDKHRNPIGTATRKEIHMHGHWHETFHFWLIEKAGNTHYLYFQRRSKVKKDSPNLLDITAAGHLLENETVEDGIREVQEEIGLQVTIHDLAALGVIPYTFHHDGFLDNEFAHVFIMMNTDLSWDDFQLQEEEVTGIVKVNLHDFYELWFGDKAEIDVEGFEIDGAGKRIPVKQHVGREKFVPHEDRFYEATLAAIFNYLSHQD